MRKFLLKLLIYALTLSAITTIIDLYYLYHIHQVNDVTIPDGIQICNFGSSHGQRGFNYEDFRGKYVCCNFSMTAQALIYDSKLLMHYKGKLKQGAYVFIVVSYFSFFGKPETEHETFLAKNKRYYRVLPPELIINYDRYTDIYTNYLPALSFAGVHDLIRLLLYGKKITYEGFIMDNDIWTKSAVLSDMEDVFHHYEVHIADNLDQYGNRLRKQESFDAVYTMINLCRDIGARPILVTVPFTRAYTDTIRKNDPNFFADFYSVIDEIKQNSGVEYYDYAFDERFCDNLALFNDTNHLNKEGARRFTNILLREVLGITP